MTPGWNTELSEGGASKHRDFIFLLPALHQTIALRRRTTTRCFFLAVEPCLRSTQTQSGNFFFPPLREEKRPFAKLSSGIPPASPWAHACVTSGEHRCAGKAFPHSHIPSWPCAPGPVTGSLQSCSADPSPVTSDPRPEVSRYSFSVSRFAFPGYFYPWPCRSRGWLCVWTFPASILHLVKLLLARVPLSYCTDTRLSRSQYLPFLPLRNICNKLKLPCCL